MSSALSGPLRNGGCELSAVGRSEGRVAARCLEWPPCLFRKRRRCSGTRSRLCQHNSQASPFPLPLFSSSQVQRRGAKDHLVHAAVQHAKARHGRRHAHPPPRRAGWLGALPGHGQAEKQGGASGPTASHTVPLAQNTKPRAIRRFTPPQVTRERGSTSPAKRVKKEAPEGTVAVEATAVAKQDGEQDVKVKSSARARSRAADPDGPWLPVRRSCKRGAGGNGQCRFLTLWTPFCMPSRSSERERMST